MYIQRDCAGSGCLNLESVLGWDWLLTARAAMLWKYQSVAILLSGATNPVQLFTGIYRGAIFTWLTSSGLLVAGDSMHLWSLRVYVYCTCIQSQYLSACTSWERINKEAWKVHLQPRLNQLMCKILKDRGEGDNLTKGCEVIFPWCKNDLRTRLIVMCCYILAIKLRAGLINSCNVYAMKEISLWGCVKINPWKSISSPAHFVAWFSFYISNYSVL